MEEPGAVDVDAVAMRHADGCAPFVAERSDTTASLDARGVESPSLPCHTTRSASLTLVNNTHTVISNEAGTAPA